MTPHPDVIDALCQSYRRIPRADIIACWKNASRHWHGLHPVCMIQEPPELTAARTLFVHSQLDPVADDRSMYSFVMWSLVIPHTVKKV